MMKTILRILVLSSTLSTATYGYNAKLLDLDADAFAHQLYSGVSIKKDEITKALGFLNEGDTVDEKYSQKNQLTFYEKIKGQLQDDKFTKFAEMCKGVYDENDAEHKKIAVLMLLEDVAEKYGEFLKKLARARQIAAEQPKNTMPLSDSFLDMFATADKS